MNRSTLERRLAWHLARDRSGQALRRAALECDCELWVVGGWPRDLCLGRKPIDLDLVAGAGLPRLIESLRHAWGTRGFRFRKRGVTTWRFDRAGTTIDIVDARQRGLRRDLRRRDFTMNAIAFDLRRQRLIDPTGGLRDLERRRLRLAGSRALTEDPLRALRAARFLAQIPDLSPVRGLEAKFNACAAPLRRVSVERVRHELNRLLLARAPAAGLRALFRWQLLPAILPELVPLATCVAGAERPDVWTHTVDAIEQSGRARLPATEAIADESNRAVLRWALLLHDISKPETFEVRQDGRPAFHGHEVKGAARADKLLRRLKAPKHERRRVVRLVLHHLRPGHLTEQGLTERGARRLLRDLSEDLPLLVRHAACDAQASGSPDGPRRWARMRGLLEELLRRHRQRRPEAARPLIDGREVMRLTALPPGPAVGSLLSQLVDRQEAGEIRSVEEARRWILQSRER